MMMNQDEELPADRGDEQAPSSDSANGELMPQRPVESASQYDRSDNRRGLFLVPSDDGRVRVPNPRNVPREELQDIGVVLDSQIAGAVAKGPGQNGDAFTLAALRFESDVEESAPRNPLERTLVSSILLTAELQRRLLQYAGASNDIKAMQRFSALALTAANDVRRGCLAFDALRRPPVKIGNAAQVNVSGGNQAIQNNAERPASPTAVVGVTDDGP